MPSHGNATRRTIVRRAMLGGAVGLGLAATQTARPSHAALPGAVRLLAPGPEDALLARWATRLAVSLVRGSNPALEIGLEVLGGPDGVTAANRFTTDAAGDGRLLLALPGSAALARLVGDPRAKFDPAGWLPVCASLGSAVLAGRRPLAAPGAPLRLAMGGPEGFAAAALLALDLLGATPTALPGLPPAAAEQALREGAADAVLLQGAEVPARLAAGGLFPWLVLDSIGAGRDPLLPEVPCLTELVPATASSALLAGCLAAGSAARLLAALVLPPLTSADMVALWRAAAQRWPEEEGRAAPNTARAVSGAEASATLAGLAPPLEAMQAYRAWLLRRFNWRAEP